MTFFKGALAKEGKGVEKGEKKSPVRLFCEIYFRKFWKLCQVGFVYLVACIPTFFIASRICGILTDIVINDAVVQTIKNQASGEVETTIMLAKIVYTGVITLFLTAVWGMGPVTAGYTYVLRNYAREEHAWPWSDFWEFTWKNFRQAICVWLVDMVVLWLLINAFMFYGSVLKYVILCLLLAYTLMHFYIYQLMVTYKLKLKEIYKFSFLFAVVSLPANLLVLAVAAAIHLGLGALMLYIPNMGYWAIYMILAMFVLQGTSGLLMNFVAHRTISRYMKGEEKEDISPEKQNGDDEKYLI